MVNRLAKLVGNFRGKAPAAVGPPKEHGFIKNFLFGDEGFVRQNPVAAGIGGLGLAGMLGQPIVKGIRSGYTDYDFNRQVAAVKAEKENRRYMAGMNQQREEVEKELARQAARLAAANPNLYNQIMAGRRLPQGAVLLGGQPRTDLMEQIAYGMASNPQLQQPGPMMAPQDQFLNELGV
tara:strand:+ start:3703 stop:4239 length:537 start_codon:yes stop_codon:yes gene_type:complete